MIKSFFKFLALIYSQRGLIVSMAKRQIATSHVGSTLGFFWLFIRPAVFIGVLWFVFSIGFKVQPVKDVPFVVWLTAGMSVWTLFTEILMKSTGSIIGNRNLIKKTIFPSQILPFITIISSLITHGIFLILLITLILCFQMSISIYFLQTLYYLLCVIVLTLGLSWTFSALNVFSRDIEQIVGVILQVGFWATPIFWNIEIMPDKSHFFIKLNPMFYIVQGYRESFITFTPFWHHPYLSIYFWLVALGLFVLGALVFRRLKPQFADVL